MEFEEEQNGLQPVGTGTTIYCMKKVCVFSLFTLLSAVPAFAHQRHHHEPPAVKEEPLPDKKPSQDLVFAEQPIDCSADG